MRPVEWPLAANGNSDLASFTDSGRDRMNIKSIAVALLVAFASAVSPAATTAQPNFYVMRHLHTRAGVSDPDLTPEGMKYALAVSYSFERDPPDVIYVSSTKRAQQTAAPLAQRLKLTPKIYDPRDTPGLIAAVSAETGTVLVVGHSNTVPDIIEKLGGKRPPDLTHEDFGDIWHVFGPERTTRQARIIIDAAPR
jgi:phosphohistidine phosphatase SixA